MSSRSNRDVIRSAFAAISDGDMDTFESLIADDVVEHEEFPGLEPNKAGVLAFFGHLQDAFPDLEWIADDIIADGDMVAVRGRMKGTHEGEFAGVPASGNAVDVAFGDFFRLRDGKIVEHWGVADTGEMMRQLGAGDG